MYKPNRMKYKLASDLGKVTECRICEFKRVTKDNFVAFDFTTRKFKTYGRLNWWEALLHVTGIKIINPGV